MAGLLASVYISSEIRNFVSGLIVLEIEILYTGSSALFCCTSVGLSNLLFT